ncbi:MAG TPA: Crp/Fnr family transcriptional regulator [Chroococcales cyanobacterium]
MAATSSQKDIIDVFSAGKLQRFSKGELIVHGADEPQGVYLITHGLVKIYSINDEGEEYVHIVYKPGEIFPLIWALIGTERKVFYEALVDTVVWCVSAGQFRATIQENARTSYAVLMQLAKQFSIYSDRIDNLEYKRARERLVYRLIFLASRFGKARGSSIVLEPAFSQQLIASSINLARESVSREFEKLTVEGLIGYKGRHIVINDLEALSKELSEPTSDNLWGLRSSKD